MVAKMASALRAVLFAVAFGATVGPLACRQLVGIGDAPPMGDGGARRDAAIASEGGPGDAAIDGIAYPMKTCAACAATNCGSQSAACAADSVCNPRETCLARCEGAPACRSQCFVHTPVGLTAPLVAALDVCLASNCDTVCNLPTCGDVASEISPPDAAAT